MTDIKNIVTVALITAKNGRDRKPFVNIPLLVPFSCIDLSIFELAEIILWYINNVRFSLQDTLREPGLFSLETSEFGRPHKSKNHRYF